MIDLDGTAGGGQLLRSALTLSALTGAPFRMTGIRGARSNPGLGPQHLAAVRAVADVCDADVEGDALESEEVTFRPGGLRPGRFEAEIGTAGSVTLLFDAVLPLGAAVDGPLTVDAAGGTDVKWSPTAAYYRSVKLPLLRRYGLDAAFDLGRTGFYPAGGGGATLRIGPSRIGPIELVERGAREGARIYSKASEALAGRDVAERQADAAADRLSESGVGPVDRRVAYVEADSVGSALLVRLDYEGAVAGFDALGERGKPAEDVGTGAADAAAAFDRGSAAVDRHMADQLIVFLGTAGGRAAIPAVTDHVRTNRDLLAAFGFDVGVELTEGGAVLEA